MKWFYVYKITFEEVPHFYMGVRTSSVYPTEDKYLGSPITHKNYWKIYSPKKFIFHGGIYSSLAEAKRMEETLIKLNLKNPFCLNKACGGWISLDSCLRGGLTTSQKLKEDLKFALHHREKGRLGGIRSAELRAVRMKDDPEFRNKTINHLTDLSYEINKRRELDPDFDLKFRKSRAKASKNTIWITNGTNNRRVPSSYQIEPGWRTGRTICKE